MLTPEQYALCPGGGGGKLNGGDGGGGGGGFGLFARSSRVGCAKISPGIKTGKVMKASKATPISRLRIVPEYHL